MLFHLVIVSMVAVSGISHASFPTPEISPLYPSSAVQPSMRPESYKLSCSPGAHLRGESKPKRTTLVSA